MPAPAARRGEAGAPEAAPTSIRPLSGAWTPARIFTSVDLPDPFSPTMQCTSPARSSNEQDRSACVAPKAFARSTVRSATAALGAGASEVGVTVSMPADKAALSPLEPRTTNQSACSSFGLVQEPDPASQEPSF